MRPCKDQVESPHSGQQVQHLDDSLSSLWLHNDSPAYCSLLLTAQENLQTHPIMIFSELGNAVIKPTGMPSMIFHRIVQHQHPQVHLTEIARMRHHCSPTAKLLLYLSYLSIHPWELQDILGYKGQSLTSKTVNYPACLFVSLSWITACFKKKEKGSAFIHSLFIHIQLRTGPF